MPREQILIRSTEQYLGSQQFNGLMADSLLNEFDEAAIRQAVESLIREQLISLNFGIYHPNPHIKALPPQSPEEQVAMMHERGMRGACIYPERAHLVRVVDQRTYQNSPYTLALALGDAQLSYRAFELAVLERYRNDPRYLYQNDDISGSLSIRNEFYGPAGAPDRDQVSM